jgi:hypothetical protein
MEMGYRNAVHVLERLDLAVRDDDGQCLPVNDVPDFETAARLVWEAAKTEETLQAVHDFFDQHPHAKGKDVGELIERKEGQKWSEASRLRTGNALIAWAAWIAAKSIDGKVPAPPGPRVRAEMREKLTPKLFETQYPPED